MGRRFISEWAYRSFLYGMLLLLLNPVIGSDCSRWVFAIFLRFPGYLLHQYKEHGDGRLPALVNQTFSKASDLLIPPAAFTGSLGT